MPISRRRKPATRPAIAFGIGLGTTSDSVDTAGAIFQSFGAELVDAKGNITVKTDTVRQALEYCAKLAKFYPAGCAGLGRRLEQQVARSRAAAR